MGVISYFAQRVAYRLYKTDGVVASGIHSPTKQELWALIEMIEKAIATAPGSDLSARVTVLEEDLQAGINSTAVSVSDPTYAFSVQDEDGKVAFGIRHNGDLYYNSSDSPWLAYTKGADGSRQVYAHSNLRGEINISLGEGTEAFAPIVEGRSVRFLVNTGASLVQRRVPLNMAVSFDAGVTDVDGTFGLGQSAGTGFGSVDVVTGTTVSATRSGMFNGGVRPSRSAQVRPDLAIPDDFIHDVVPLKERKDDFAGETFASQYVAGRLAATASSHGEFAAAFGIGGQDLAALLPGTLPYSEMVRGMRQFRRAMLMTGRNSRMPVAYWNHGESYAGDQATYYAGLGTLFTQWNADATAIFGQSSTLMRMFTTIRSSYTLLPFSERAKMQYAAAFPNKLVVVCPQYMLGYTDNVHPNARGQTILGAYLQKAVTDYLAGGTGQGLRMTSAVRTGASVVCSFSGRVGNLQWNAGPVTNPGNHGFSWLDTGDGNVVSISGVAITGGGTTVTITLSGTPTASAGFIGLCVDGVGDTSPTSGPRTDLSDSETRTVTLPGSEVYTLVNRALPVIVPVT